MTRTLQIEPPTDEAQLITSEIWETASSAAIMLQMLCESKTFRQADRIIKYEQHFHLFAASCARRLTHLLIDPRSVHATRTAELFAAGAKTRAEMHRAHLHAEAAVIQLADTYNQALPTTENPAYDHSSRSHPTGLDTRILFGASVLHAAATASMCCYAQQIFGGLQAAEASAKYSSKALYWELVTNGADTILITEFLEEEDRRQAQALRVFLGNPFYFKNSAAMTLPPPTHNQVTIANCTGHKLLR
jgi:hypothetical protein